MPLGDSTGICTKVTLEISHDELKSMILSGLLEASPKITEKISEVAFKSFLIIP